MKSQTNCHDCPSLKVDDEKKLHDGRNIANPADDEDGDLELLNNNLYFASQHGRIEY